MEPDIVTIRQKRPVISIMGPTGIGKTQLAIALVERFPLEIISVDSAMVYRTMDIGTAKPSVEELQLAPHRLINMCDPATPYSVDHFRQDAQIAIQDIHQKGKVPLLVGGTFLYFKALLQGLAELPAADQSVRERLTQQAEQLGWPAMHQQLASVDAATAKRLHPNDQQRIQRALEVFHISGQPMSVLLAKGAADAEQLNPYHCLNIALWPQDRSKLHSQLATRLDHMLAQGFLQEVEQLYMRSDLHLDLPALRSVGYRQFWQYLAGIVDETTAKSQALAATRQLAKRQLTWQRSWEGLTSLISDDTLIKTSAFSKVASFLKPYRVAGL